MEIVMITWVTWGVYNRSQLTHLDAEGLDDVEQEHAGVALVAMLGEAAPKARALDALMERGDDLKGREHQQFRPVRHPFEFDEGNKAVLATEKKSGGGGRDGVCCG